MKKAKRTKAPIAWKDGLAVLALANSGKEKAMVDAFQEHFLKHPLAEIALGAATSQRRDVIGVSQESGE